MSGRCKSDKSVRQRGHTQGDLREEGRYANLRGVSPDEDSRFSAKASSTIVCNWNLFAIQEIDEPPAAHEDRGLRE